MYIYIYILVQSYSDDRVDPPLPSPATGYTVRCCVYFYILVGIGIVETYVVCTVMYYLLSLHLASSSRISGASVEDQSRVLIHDY